MATKVKRPGLEMPILTSLLFAFVWHCYVGCLEVKKKIRERQTKTHMERETHRQRERERGGRPVHMNCEIGKKWEWKHKILSLLLKIFAYFFPHPLFMSRVDQKAWRTNSTWLLGFKAFRASWCGGTWSPILRSCYCCYFFFFSACICIGLLCFRKFALI